MDLAGYRDVISTDRETLIKLNLSWTKYFPSCSSQPWQVDGVLSKLLADGLVDRLYWVQAPVWLGDRAVPAFPGIAAHPLADAPRWIPVARRTLGPDTLLVLDRRLCLPAS